MSNEQSAEIRELTTTIDFGFQVEAFIKSPIGTFLIARAEGEIEDALEGLKKVSPNDPAAIVDLQNRVYRAESIQYWLAEAIQTGMNAQREFIERERGD